MVGRDPWMVPQRTLAPVWSPDSKRVACASRLKSRYRAILVTNVDTGETKRVTDGRADAMYAVFDASGKYLWFLASTDFGLRSKWLDMTSRTGRRTSLRAGTRSSSAPSRKRCACSRRNPWTGPRRNRRRGVTRAAK
jgi:Tol biopolymer transport system component